MSSVAPGVAIFPPVEAFAWTPQTEALALRLFLFEGHSAAQIAAVLGGVSRAAVLSKLRRLGCRKGDVHHRPMRSPAPTAVRDPIARPPSAAWPPIPLPPLRQIGPSGTPSTLARLPDGCCRWPIDDPGPGRMHEALFCGGAPVAGAYCAAHRALATRGAEAKETPHG